MIHTDTTPAEEVNDVVIELPELGRQGQGAGDDGEAPSPSPPAPSPPAGPSLSIPQLILPMYLPSLLLGITIGMVSTQVQVLVLCNHWHNNQI